jgi:hypothetical protein
MAAFATSDPIFSMCDTPKTNGRASMHHLEQLLELTSTQTTKHATELRLCNAVPVRYKRVHTPFCFLLLLLLPLSGGRMGLAVLTHRRTAPEFRKNCAASILVRVTVD